MGAHPASCVPNARPWFSTVQKDFGMPQPGRLMCSLAGSPSPRRAGGGTLGIGVWAGMEVRENAATGAGRAEQEAAT